MKVCLLANGPSLSTVDLSRVTLPVMGMNRSYKVCNDPDYHVALEGDHLRAAPDFFSDMARAGRLYVAGGSWTIGKVMPILPSSVGFSKDIKQGVVTEMHGVGSVFYVALQVAYSLGYREVFALGLDLRGDHFDGSPASPHVAKQNAMFAHIPEDMKVWTCGSPDSLATFEKCGFDEVCA